MRKNIAILLAMVLVIALFAVACGGDDTSKEEEAATFAAVVHNFVSDDPLPGITVYPVNNNNGEILDGFEPQVSDNDGMVYFENLPEGVVGFLCEGIENQTADTYQFNIDSAAMDEKLWSVDWATYKTAPLGANLELVDGLGTAAGAVYWCNNAEERAAGGCSADYEEIVGCSTVETEPSSGEPRYFGPTRLPYPLTSQKSVNPVNGYFLFGNIDPGLVKVKAMVNGQEIGSTEFVSMPDAICIGNIYATTDSNPAPADCK